MHISEKSSIFAPAFEKEMKRRVSVMLFLLTALMAVIGSSTNCRPRTAAESRTTVPAPQQINYIVTNSDCAIPVQIAKIQLTVIHLSARQQLKRLSQSVFGLPANIATSYSTARTIHRSRKLLRSLETYDIGFPFSVFW